MCRTEPGVVSLLCNKEISKYEVEQLTETRPEIADCGDVLSFSRMPQLHAVG
jgi:hypothetical protein